MSRILVIDDEIDILDSLSAVLQDEGHQVTCSTCFNEQLVLEDFDILLLDVWLEDQNGLDILKMAQKRAPRLPVIMISGHGNIEMAVDAVKDGAYDFLEKPLSLERVTTSVNNALLVAKMGKDLAEAKNLGLKANRLIGSHESIKRILESLSKIARSRSHMLITGEPGTGKMLVAKHLYYHHPELGTEFSTIVTKTMVKDEIEEALFGSEKNGTTGKLEHPNGIVFIHEISLIPLKVQLRLYEAIEEKRFRRVGGKTDLPMTAQIIAASTEPFDALSNKLSNDFLQAISQFHLHLPPLRERREDIPQLLDYYAKVAAKGTDSKPLVFEAEVAGFLQSYFWPGNIRELITLIERLNVLAAEQKVTLDLLELHLNSHHTPWTHTDKATTLKEALRLFERNYILYVLQRNKGNVTRTSEELKLERTHLHRKMSRLGIKRIRYSEDEENQKNRYAV